MTPDKELLALAQNTPSQASPIALAIKRLAQRPPDDDQYTPPPDHDSDLLHGLYDVSRRGALSESGAPPLDMPEEDFRSQRYDNQIDPRTPQEREGPFYSQEMLPNSMDNFMQKFRPEEYMRKFGIQGKGRYTEHPGADIRDRNRRYQLMPDETNDSI